MTIRIKATQIIASELVPGDLFSTVGPDYWNMFQYFESVGERVFVRTFALADGADDSEALVYKIEIERT
jgi:hypothetical protein